MRIVKYASPVQQPTFVIRLFLLVYWWPKSVECGSIVCRVPLDRNERTTAWLNLYRYSLYSFWAIHSMHATAGQQRLTATAVERFSHFMPPVPVLLTQNGTETQAATKITKEIVLHGMCTHGRMEAKTQNTRHSRCRRHHCRVPTSNGTHISNSFLYCINNSTFYKSFSVSFFSPRFLLWVLDIELTTELVDFGRRRHLWLWLMPSPPPSSLLLPSTLTRARNKRTKKNNVKTYPHQREPIYQSNEFFFPCLAESAKHTPLSSSLSSSEIDEISFSITFFRRQFIDYFFFLVVSFNRSIVECVPFFPSATETEKRLSADANICTAFDSRVDGGA